MAAPPTTPGTDSPGELYGAEYYHSHCGDIPYIAGSSHWQGFYGRVADELVRSFTPERVFDAGCAVGFLVAALWDRNVEAHGRDISEFAISQVRADVRPYCSVGSITDPIEGEFDLVLCVEVLEHMPEAEAIQAITTITNAAPRVLFSSTPSDFDEPTHVNVRPTLYWLQRFAEAGFAPVVTYDTTFLCPHGVLFERREEGRSERDLAAFAEIVRQRILTAEEAARTHKAERRLADLSAVLAMEEEARRAAEADWHAQVLALEEQKRQLERAAVLPLRVHRLGARASRLAWWTVTLQLPDRLRERRRRLAAQTPPGQSASGISAPPAGPVADAHERLTTRFSALDPLRTFAVPGTGRRLNIVTDSVGAGSLYGGVGTSFVIARLLAERLDASLRLVTRRAPADSRRVGLVLEPQGLAWPGEIETVYAPELGDVSVPVGKGDMFLTTSWWTTRATLASIPTRQVIYLLQEDERMFHPRGDDRLRCAETLAQPDLHLVVNSELLHRHLSEGPEALTGMAGRATWFEPAFPENLFHDTVPRPRVDGRRSLLFYARPNNLRNLYWRGLEALSAAIEEGILDPAEWRFTFVGTDIEHLSLPGGVVPTIVQNLPWDSYAEVIRAADLGLALMDTPHVSYPPLDLAASGAVVVTNTCGIKQSLETYSRNIITVPPSVDDICRGLAEGVALAADDDARRRNYAQSRIPRDWRTTLEATIRQCAEWVEG